MASIKLGAIASDIRGSIGGTVFSRNGGGAYAKQRVCPTNPNSLLQQTVRAIMATCYAAWSLLSAAVRADWDVYAKNVTLPNRLGDQINLSGYNMYCRTRAICAKIGATVPAAAPTIMTLAEQDNTLYITADASDKKISVIFNNALGWANEVGGKLICYQGKPQNATVNSYDGPFVHMGTISGALTPPTSPSLLDPLYTISAGQKCFMQFRILRADGRLSTPFRYNCVVQS